MIVCKLDTRTDPRFARVHLMLTHIRICSCRQVLGKYNDVETIRIVEKVVLEPLTIGFSKLKVIEEVVS